MVTTRALMPLAWLAVPLAPPGTPALTMLAAAQFLFWVLMGIEGPNELGYRQSVTPDRLQGRMNTTIGSLNRGAIVVGAPLGGLIADAAAHRALARHRRPVPVRADAGLLTVAHRHRSRPGHRG
jgi:MFS family permease